MTGDAAITIYSSAGLTAADKQGGLASPIALTPALSPMVLGRDAGYVLVYSRLCNGALFLAVGTIRVSFC